ncbi:MAG TPA: hypothetical protein VNC50_13980, partial [Planctomycetia bacterium]|nr:hypothetical protein [Planctomycetia bacterium]
MIGSKLARCVSGSVALALLCLAAQFEPRPISVDSARLEVAKPTPATTWARLESDVRYFPKGPEFPLQNELNAMILAEQERAAELVVL